ncbi:MAG: hypothetical protein IJK11_02200 [Acidaminococcaceae bacterium]|nr:hypothetical protein [Acidaminococcaceae bacterium]
MCCYILLAASVVYMLSDMAGQIYIYESSVSDAALIQAASVFKELDECLL